MTPAPSSSRSLRKGPGRPAGARSGASRKALLGAARALMAEQGLPRVTVREVAERAGVQPALVHYYFGSKDELLRAVVAEVASEMLERAQQAVSVEGPVEERLRNLIRGMVDALTADPYAPRLIMEQVLFAEDDVIDFFADHYARPNMERIRSLLEEGQRDGELREVEPMFLIPSMMGANIFFFLMAPIIRRLFGMDRITPEVAAAFAEHTAELLLRGIAAPSAAGGASE